MLERIEHFYKETTVSSKVLPHLLCGPIVRAVDAHHMLLWYVTKNEDDWQLQTSVDIAEQHQQCFAIGSNAVIRLHKVTFAQPLKENQYLGYDLINPKGEALATTAPHLLYARQHQPGFVYKRKIDRLLHGSCRRPHHPTKDGMARIDKELADSISDPAKRPALVLHSGDQIYADDVAGPMLTAIQDVIVKLGLYEEVLTGGNESDSKNLRNTTQQLYQRDQMLPDTKMNEALTEKFFGGVRKPIFTSSNAKNHLISLNEVLAMYLLVWSPTPWRFVDTDSTPDLPADQLTVFRDEQQQLATFINDLSQAARALANVPNYMIFDDHDITDDWNLSALWETTAYQHPYSRRIVGNALVGYLLCQASGNNLSAVQDLLNSYQQVSVHNQYYDASHHDELIDKLLNFEHWHYEIDRQPMVLVLDTRTRRWRSERSRSKPSGLMDWEALTEFQHKLLDQDSVIVVSPAPMFGVKLIEAIQEVFTFFGKPLLVDAENWMAHRGAADVLLNIFAHRNTPSNFTILSGDVHYSFAYDVRLKHSRSGPSIWQITSSGIKNQFPNTLLEWLDRLNRWLYAPYSPLNWFTKRRRFRIFPRRPSTRDVGERLWNRSGIGCVEFDEQGRPSVIQQLNADQGHCEFLQHDGSEPTSLHRHNESL